MLTHQSAYPLPCLPSPLPLPPSHSPTVTSKSHCVHPPQGLQQQLTPRRPRHRSPSATTHTHHLTRCHQTHHSPLTSNISTQRTRCISAPPSRPPPQPLNTKQTLPVTRMQNRCTCDSNSQELDDKQAISRALPSEYRWNMPDPPPHNSDSALRSHCPLAWKTPHRSQQPFSRVTQRVVPLKDGLVLSH